MLFAVFEQRRQGNRLRQTFSPRYAPRSAYGA
jgi:hypothetical protein